MKKRILMVLALVVSMFVLSACSPPLTEGVCIDKEHTEAYTTGWMQIIRVGNTSIPQWRTIYHSATWKLKVSGVNAEGKEVVEWWNVSQEVYTNIDIGDIVMRGKSQEVRKREISGERPDGADV